MTLGVANIMGACLFGGQGYVAFDGSSIHSAAIQGVLYPVVILGVVETLEDDGVQTNCTPNVRKVCVFRDGFELELAPLVFLHPLDR